MGENLSILGLSKGLISGAPVFDRVLQKLRAMNVKDWWSLNSRSSLHSINCLREECDLPRVDTVTLCNLRELEDRLDEQDSRKV